MHICNHCGNRYKTKRAHQDHYMFCNFYHNALEPNTSMEKCMSIPDMNVMFYYLQHLCKKVSKLEKDNAKLLAHIGRKQDKTHIISWLNENVQGMEICDWASNINYDELFQNVFDNGLEHTLYVILERYSVKECIKSVGNKFQYLCVYHKNKWELWNNNRMMYILNHITNVFLDLFNNWTSEHKTLVVDDPKKSVEYYNKFAPANLNKIYLKLINAMKDQNRQSILL